MATLHEKLWLMGEDPDGHYSDDGETGLPNQYNLPGHSRMTAIEGLYYLDIPNMCRVRIKGSPMPPYDQHSEAMRPCREVTWSLLGAGGDPSLGWTDTDEVIKQANMYPNITGGFYDDFFGERRRTYYTPEKLREIRKRCDDGVKGRKLDMWVTLYEYNLEQIPNVKEWLDEFDVITLWVWRASNLPKIEEYYKQLRAIAPDKRIVAGMFMYNYGERRPMTVADMEFQADFYLRSMKEGWLDGIMVCGNPVCDLGLDSVEWTRNWIQAHKNDVFN